MLEAVVETAENAVGSIDEGPVDVPEHARERIASSWVQPRVLSEQSRRARFDALHTRDQISGQVRYMGGVLEFMDGIEVVLVAVGLFAVSEALYNALYEGRSEAAQHEQAQPRPHDRRTVETIAARAGCAAPLWASRSAAFRRAAPEIPTFLSYATERKAGRARAPERVRHHRRD